MSSRLLILSCSARKRPNHEPLPAVERYDGPAFRVYRRFRSAQAEAGVRLLVLSAEFGLITESHPVPAYDRLLTAKRAAELRPVVRDVLARTVEESTIEEALVYTGRRYRAAFPDPLPEPVCWRIVEGPPGARLSKLHDWLYGSPPAAPPSPSTTNPIRIRGREVALSREELLELARERLIQDTDAAERWHSWYVSVGKVRVAPKWLVSQATGLSVSAFSTDDARRALAQLGIEVHRA